MRGKRKIFALTHASTRDSSRRKRVDVGGGVEARNVAEVVRGKGRKVKRCIGCYWRVKGTVTE